MICPVDKLKKSEEIVITLSVVPSWGHGKGANSAWRHAVTVLFMRLHIFPKFKLTKAIKVHRLPGDDGAGTKIFQHTIGKWE
jgi:3-oxoacyl-(acyl-carrier-protein) synthase